MKLNACRFELASTSFFLNVFIVNGGSCCILEVFRGSVFGFCTTYIGIFFFFSTICMVALLFTDHDFFLI